MSIVLGRFGPFLSSFSSSAITEESSESVLSAFSVLVSFSVLKLLLITSKRKKNTDSHVSKSLLKGLIERDTTNREIETTWKSHSENTSKLTLKSDCLEEIDAQGWGRGGGSLVHISVQLITNNAKLENPLQPAKLAKGPQGIL